MRCATCRGDRPPDAAETPPAMEPLAVISPWPEGVAIPGTGVANSGPGDPATDERGVMSVGFRCAPKGRGTGGSGALLATSVSFEERDWYIAACAVDMGSLGMLS